MLATHGKAPQHAAMPIPALSVIIPCLNETAALDLLLADLRAQTGIALQILIADGGSRDATLAVAKRWGARVVVSGAGRGLQMNTARAHAEHADLLFLHADSRLPHAELLSTAWRALQAEPMNSAGHFALRFDRSDATHSTLYRHMERKSALNRPETINGDQGLMLSGAFFDALGGFEESLPFLEDQAISCKIFAQGRWLLLPGYLRTSARRFEAEGVGQRYFLMMLIMCARRAGVTEFYAQARTLYPIQSDATRLHIAPFYDLLLEMARQHPDFWPQMAHYALDNTWQLPFWLDNRIGTTRGLTSFDKIGAPHPRTRRLAAKMLAPTLRALFSGPVRWWVHKVDRAAVDR